jgi:Glycine zipper
MFLLPVKHFEYLVTRLSFSKPFFYNKRAFCTGLEAQITCSLKIIIMKKILMVFAISSIFLSCKNKSKTDLSIDKNMVLTDTALLHRSGIYSDTAYKTGLIKNEDGTTTTTSSTTTVTTTTTSSSNAPQKASTTNTGTKAKTASTNNTSAGSGTSTTQAPAPVQRDKGWSSAAKGTAIGAGSGAILGAVVSKKKVQGAIVGGVIGAAGGYVIGRDMDKKSGRVERNKQ